MKNVTINVSFNSWVDQNDFPELFARSRQEVGNHLKLTDLKVFALSL